MCQALKDVLRLDKKNDMGITRRDELEQVKKQTGESISELEYAEIPDCVNYLWQWFVELSSSRSSSGFGANPISYLEINAWDKLNMHWIRPWEVETIKRMDAIFLDFQRENSKQQTAKK